MFCHREPDLGKTDNSYLNRFKNCFSIDQDQIQEDVCRFHCTGSKTQDRSHQRKASSSANERRPGGYPRINPNLTLCYNHKQSMHLPGFYAARFQNHSSSHFLHFRLRNSSLVDAIGALLQVVALLHGASLDIHHIAVSVCARARLCVVSACARCLGTYACVSERRRDKERARAKVRERGTDGSREGARGRWRGVALLPGTCVCRHQ
jgi:hypothetical protein